MIKRLITGLFVSGIALVGGLTVQHVQAASPICTLKDGIQAFVESRGSDPQLELDARKGLLFIISDCTKEETESALAALDSVDVQTSSGLTSAKQVLTENLKLEFEYVDSQKGRISDVGMRGTRDLARTLKEWRLNTHLPQTGNANNFVLWEKNQELLGVAENRSRQIEQTLKTLKLSDRQEIRAHVDEAKTQLQDARDATKKAEGSLQSLENPDVTARLLQSSFSSLSSAYTSFLGVSEEVKKILPF